MLSDTTTVGELLRDWRQRRRLSQLDLASEAEISQRHLSFIESGRSAPSREMVLHLAEQLSVPPRESNTLLTAAGYAPVYSTRSGDDPQFAAAKKAVSLILKGHEPFPALAIDRHWHMIEANGAVAPLIADVDCALLEPPVNVLRLSLHPNGLAPRIENYGEWREHVLRRLSQQIELTADRGLIALRDELKGYQTQPQRRPLKPSLGLGGIAVPFKIATDAGVLSFLTTTTVFGTALDISLSELAIESFFPADEATANGLIGLRHANESP